MTADKISGDGGLNGYSVLMVDISGIAHWSKVTADMIDAPITWDMTGSGNSGLLTYNGSGLSWLNKVLTPTYNIIPYGDDGEVQTTGILKAGGGLGASGISGYAYAGLITANDLAQDAVATYAIVNSAITSAKIANGTIIAEDLAGSSVTKSKIANGAVTIDKTAGVVGMVPVGAADATTYGQFWIE